MTIPSRSFGEKNQNIISFTIIGILLLVIILLATLVSGGMELKIIILTVGIIASAVCFFNTELALYLVIFAMLFSPEFSFGGGLAEDRSFVIRLEDIIILIVFSSWLFKTAIYKGIGLFVKTPFNRPIQIYIFVSLLATLIGAIYGRLHLLSGTLYVFKYMEYFLVFFMFVNNITEREQVKRFIIASIIVAVLTGIYAWVQIPLGVRVSAPFEGEMGEPNTFGGYLVLIISILLGFWSTIPDRKIKTLALFLVIFFSVPFLYTLSRSSWVAAIPMFFSFFFLTNKKGFLIFIALFFVLIAPVVLPDIVKERIKTTFIPEKGYAGTERVGGVGFDPSTSARIGSFKYAIKKWTEHPLFGNGVTGVGLIDGMYFRLLAETGIAGMTAFLYLMFVVIFYLYRCLKRAHDPLLVSLSLGMLAATLALLGHSVGAASFIIVRIMEPYWFFIAAVFILSEIDKEVSLKAVPVKNTPI